MTRRFTCRGFEGNAWYDSWTGYWHAEVVVAGVAFEAKGGTKSEAKSRVRRKLDAVERAFRERGLR